MRTDIVQKAVVLNANNELLILKRSETDKRRPLQWDLPGGLLEPNEEMVDGVEREILEEAGLSVTGTRAIYTITTLSSWSGGECSVVRIFYVAYTDTTEVTLSDEHIEFKWVSIAEALDLISYEVQHTMLQYISDHTIDLR